MSSHPFDASTAEQLRAVGGMKWSTFPGKIGAWVAEADFGAAPPITAALHRAVDDALFGYLPRGLRQRLQEATAGWYATRYGWPIDPAMVRPQPDVLAALLHLIDHELPPAARIILPVPAYMPFLVVPGALGRELVEVPLATDAAGRYVYDLDRLEDALQPGDLLILCNPHNPVGRVLTRGEMTAIAEIVERRGARVFSDEIHAPITFDGLAHVPYASLSEATASHTVTATSASKAWNLAGLKTAQLILSNPEDLKRWKGVGPFVEEGASNLGVIANCVAYEEGGPWLDDVLAYIAASRWHFRDLLAELIPGATTTVPEGTYLAFVDFRSFALPEAPARFFRAKADVATTDGALCGSTSAGFVRFNLATPRPLITRAVEQMARALAVRSA